MQGETDWRETVCYQSKIPTRSERASMGADDWVSDYLPAIAHDADRTPEWFILRYVISGSRGLFRILDHVGQEYRHFTYLRRVPRAPDVRCAWFPGYLFFRADLVHDRWQQLLRMPNVLEILGHPSPLAAETMDDLVGRLPERLSSPTALTSVAPGTPVRLVKGPCIGHEGVVTWSDRKRAEIVSMMFGAPRKTMVKLSDIQVVA